MLTESGFYLTQEMVLIMLNAVNMSKVSLKCRPNTVAQYRAHITWKLRVPGEKLSSSIKVIIMGLDTVWAKSKVPMANAGSIRNTFKVVMVAYLVESS